MRLARTALFLAACAFPATAFGQIYSTPFDDDGGWTMTGNFAACSFHVDATPGTVAGGSFTSAPYSLNANNTPCDDIYNYTTARSPLIDLSGASAPVLRFQCNYDTAWDGCGLADRRIDVSNDGFNTGLYSDCLTTCGPTGQWHEHTIALDPQWGTIQVKFTFEVDQILFTGYPGWFIDDLLVDDDCPAPTSYCVAAPNSAAPGGAHMGFQGSTSHAANNLRLLATDCPPNQFTIFFMGSQATQAPLGDGFQCAAGAIWRYPVTTTGSGTTSHLVDYDVSPGDFIDVGSTWYFQCWFRDPQGGPVGNNLSDGLEITFCP